MPLIELSARMIFLVDRLELGVVHVGIDLRGGDVGVTEHFLNGAQVRAVRKQGVLSLYESESQE